MMESDLKSLLRNRLEDYLKENKHNSMRRFAKEIGLSPTTLSMFLNDKRNPSHKIVKKVCTNLNLSQDDINTILLDFQKTAPLLASVSTESFLERKKIAWQKELDYFMSLKGMDHSHRVTVQIAPIN